MIAALADPLEEFRCPVRSAGLSEIRRSLSKVVSRRRIRDRVNRLTIREALDDNDAAVRRRKGGAEVLEISDDEAPFPNKDEYVVHGTPRGRAATLEVVRAVEEPFLGAGRAEDGIREALDDNDAAVRRRKGGAEVLEISDDEAPFPIRRSLSKVVSRRRIRDRVNRLTIRRTSSYD
jgi:hypothetical protein